jgi:3-hydroxyacyl-CoA dehydrogenase
MCPKGNFRSLVARLSGNPGPGGYEDEKDSRFYTPPILKRKVLAGHLGRKTGKVWYEYNPDGNPRLVSP